MAALIPGYDMTCKVIILQNLWCQAIAQIEMIQSGASAKIVVEKIKFSVTQYGETSRRRAAEHR